MGVVAVEDGDLRQRHALVDALEDLLGDERRLRLGARGGRHDRQLAALADRAEVLGELLLVLRDRRVGELEDRRQRPVVGLEAEHAAAGVALGEGQDVGELGAAEGVDRLGVVADDHEVLLRAERRVDDVGLQPVGVLVLVDEDVAEAGGELAADVVVAAQEEQPVEQQVVVVHDLGGALALEVAAEHRLDGVELAGELRVARHHDLLERPPGVDHQGVHLDEERRAGQPAVRRRRRHVGERVAHQVARVLAVEDAVVVAVAEPVAEAAEQAVADRVERPAHDAAGVAAEELADAGQHLAAGPVGERQEQDAGRLDAVLDQSGDAVDDGAGLAGTGAGEHEHRPARVHHGCELLGVELGRVVDLPRRAGRGAQGNLADDRLVGHGGEDSAAGDAAARPVEG